MEEQHPALGRILKDHDIAAALDTLAWQLSPSDLVTVLLELSRHRAQPRTPADVLTQYSRDRFVAPADRGFELLELQVAALTCAATNDPRFEPMMLSPVAPLATHSALGPVSQNNVLTTTRLTEVTADPTNSLALEAAIRRRDALRADPKSAQRIRLSAAHRVLRTQRFDGPVSFAHFSQLGITTAGRDTGHRLFEFEAVAEQLAVLCQIVQATTSAPIILRVTDFDGSYGATAGALLERVVAGAVDAEVDPARTHGRGYYSPVCFKLAVVIEGLELEVGDGGLVDWTAKLVESRKERLAIAGLGLDRLLVAADAAPPQL